MIKANMHIHSKYSWDSKMELDAIVNELLSANIKYAGISDHIEFDRETLPYVLTKFQMRNEEIDKLNEEYAGNIVLLKGAEISEPHLYQDSVDALSSLKLDFIMGSIHKLDKKAKTNLEILQAKYQYYKEILKMIEARQIDIVGHFDYINRYLGEGFSDYQQINEIMAAINENNLIIEINTSAARRNCIQKTFPSYYKMKLYSLRSKLITIGTDAHKLDEVDDRLVEANYLSKTLDLNQVILKKRKREII